MTKKLIISHDIIFNEEEAQNCKVVEISVILGEEVDKAYDTLYIVNISPESFHFFNDFNSGDSSDSKTPLRKFHSHSKIYQSNDFACFTLEHIYLKL